MSDIAIPAEWQQLHWKKQVKLAEEISGKQGLEASEAKAIIEAEARKRADDSRKPAIVDPVVSDDEVQVPLRLKRDTWQGETRIRADGRITLWSLDDAKRLIAADIASRADPLPGE